jgi:hypothetical protein
MAWEGRVQDAGESLRLVGINQNSQVGKNEGAEKVRTPRGAKPSTRTHERGRNNCLLASSKIPAMGTTNGCAMFVSLTTCRGIEDPNANQSHQASM